MSIRHGTESAYSRQGCRCDRCRAFVTARHKRTDLLRHRGQWAPFIDAAPAAARLAELRAAGMTSSLIVELTGLGWGTLTQLLRSTPGRPRTTRVRPATAAAILAVEPWTLTPATPDGGPAEALRLIRGGRTLADAAAATGLSINAVTRAAGRRRDGAA